MTEQQPFWEKNLILKVVTGSQAYGTNNEDSDLDTRGICIPPIDHLVGLHTFEQHDYKDEDPNRDEVVYGLAKFVKLALDNNPNIMEILYSHDSDVLFCNQYGALLRSIRHRFLSQRIAKTYGGYARSRLQKLQNPDRQAPTGKRKELYDKFGFDTKDASHLIRLVNGATVALQTGEIQVRSGIASYLKDIRNGVYTLDEVIDRYHYEDRQMRLALENTSLPKKPDFKAVNEWLTGIHLKFIVDEG